MTDRLTAEQEAEILARVAEKDALLAKPSGLTPEEPAARAARMLLLASHALKDMPTVLAELDAVRAEKEDAITWAGQLEAALSGICSESGQPIGEIVLGRLKEKRDAR